jgi:hypothetical protein
MSPYEKPERERVTYAEPERIAVVWSDSVASADGVPSQRGFGGRFYFYDKDGTPQRVDGELAVYAFDETSGEKKSVPDRVYKFPANQLQKHFGETELGPSYSVWIPWDTVGGERKAIALMPMFKSSSNQVVKAGQSINVLPGKSPSHLSSAGNDTLKVLGSSPAVAANPITRANTAVGQSGVQLAGGLTTNGQLDNQQLSTTIGVPREMARRLQDEWAGNSVDSVSAGLSAQISYGPLSKSPSGSTSEPLASPRTTAAQEPTAGNAPLSQIETKLSSRPVFGAPGALK